MTLLSNEDELRKSVAWAYGILLGAAGIAVAIADPIIAQGVFHIRSPEGIILGILVSSGVLFFTSFIMTARHWINSFDTGGV